MDILYADDTLLVGDNSRVLNKYLSAIQKHSERYGMKLNLTKCVYICMNCTAKIRFRDCTYMTSADEATYLGSTLTKKHLTRRELESRLSGALQTAYKLKVFFKKSNSNPAWKIQVYNAVIISKLVYGLESLELVDSLKSRLDALQI